MSTTINTKGYSPTTIKLLEVIERRKKALVAAIDSIDDIKSDTGRQQVIEAYAKAGMKIRLDKEGKAITFIPSAKKCVPTHSF